ncbi:MAG: efflux RND transporter periplasmic adaptor subunit [Bacteroidetes bacterium]|jgi:Cu(I)/Ag(I) efflux system membrane fusion protein|nr:efflux RND transporter periplasmic adaptor subunit [Bacteroidota bacterium]
MNNTLSYKWTPVLAAFVFLSVLPACEQKKQSVSQEQVSMIKTSGYYTCSMHPQVHEAHPGNCPICGMKLIKVELTEDNNSTITKDRLMLTAVQIQLAAIQTDTVKMENVDAGKTITGMVSTDENRALELSARIAGRIQRLFIKATGENISIGQPVYMIYSEDLLAAEKEYLLAMQQQKLLHNPDVDYKQLIAAAENKLRLWGLSPIQINKLAASGKASATQTILSNISGIVSDIAVQEGGYVSEGATILKTQSLHNLWVEAQIYANETANYKQGDPVVVNFPDLNGLAIKGRIDFTNPELSGNSKVNLIRVDINNPQGLIRPGMQAYVTVADGKHKALAVPASAILTDAMGSEVWLKNADGSFSARMVTLGTGNQNFTPVLSGLKAGDVVVTNGAYLLNSEALFKNGGNGGMGGMKM